MQDLWLTNTDSQDMHIVSIATDCLSACSTTASGCATAANNTDLALHHMQAACESAAVAEASGVTGRDLLLQLAAGSMLVAASNPLFASQLCPLVPARSMTSRKRRAAFKLSACTDEYAWITEEQENAMYL